MTRTPHVLRLSDLHGILDTLMCSTGECLHVASDVAAYDDGDLIVLREGDSKLVQIGTIRMDLGTYVPLEDGEEPLSMNPK